MKTKMIMLLAIIVALWVIVGFAGKALEEPKQEVELAKIYQSPMVVAEMKHQAKEPEVQNIITSKESNKERNKESNTEHKKITANITHYCACSSCNGEWSYIEEGLNYTQTASGVLLYDGIGGNYCAATFGNLGDILTINGVDYKIVDRMGGNSGKRIDIFVAEGHEKCNELGRYTAEVELKK